MQLPRDQRDRNRLALCTVVLSGRTAKSIDRLTAAVSEIVEEFTRRLFRMHGLSPPTEMEIKAANPADDLAPAISVETVFDMQPLISDLRMKLLIATVGNQFITSDHPTVITNQRFQGRADFPSTSGLAMKGIQLFLPLSPSACLMLYDPSCYRVGGGRAETVVIDRQGDMDGLNALQILNADSVVYFRCERYAASVLALRGKFMQRRRQVTKEATQKFRTQKGGTLFMLNKDDIPMPAQWPFCKTIRRAPTNFAPRDSEVVGLYRKWGDEQKTKRETECRSRSGFNSEASEGSTLGFLQSTGHWSVTSAVGATIPRASRVTVCRAANLPWVDNFYGDVLGAGLFQLLARLCTWLPL